MSPGSHPPPGNVRIEETGAQPARQRKTDRRESFPQLRQPVLLHLSSERSCGFPFQERRSDFRSGRPDDTATWDLQISDQVKTLLKKAGLVESTRGAGGGYRLGRPAEEISVGDVLRVLEGSLEAAQCSGMEDESTCENHDICVTKYVWKRINDSITQAVDTMMLDQLIEESRKKQKEKM